MVSCTYHHEKENHRGSQSAQKPGLDEEIIDDLLRLDGKNNEQQPAVVDLGGFQMFQLKSPLSWILKFITYNNSQQAELTRNLIHTAVVQVQVHV